MTDTSHAVAKPEAVTQATEAPIVPRHRLLTSFLSSPLAQFGAALTFVILAAALLAPLLAPQNPYDLSQLMLMDAFKPPAWLEGGDPQYLLGSDEQGRDILSAILYGARTSILIGFLGVCLSGVIGTLIGVLCGYRGGAVDSILMRVADIQLSLPSIMIALFIVYFSEPSIANVIIAITIVEWVLYARSARANTIVEREKTYIDAGRAMGASDARIIFRYVIPNIVTPMLVIANVRFAWVIILEASLSFLGAGVPPEQPSLGRLILNGYQLLFSGNWWISVLPGAALVALILGVNLLGDWLRDTLNPKFTEQ